MLPTPAPWRRRGRARGKHPAVPVATQCNMKRCCGVMWRLRRRQAVLSSNGSKQSTARDRARRTGEGTDGENHPAERQWQVGEDRCRRSRHAAPVCVARQSRPPRPALRLRPRPVRRLHGACRRHGRAVVPRSEEHTSELQSRGHLVCRLLLEKKKKKLITNFVVKKKKKEKQNT